MNAIIVNGSVEEVLDDREYNGVFKLKLRPAVNPNRTAQQEHIVNVKVTNANETHNFKVGDIVKGIGTIKQTNDKSNFYIELSTFAMTTDFEHGMVFETGRLTKDAGTITIKSTGNTLSKIDLAITNSKKDDPTVYVGLILQEYMSKAGASGKSLADFLVKGTQVAVRGSVTINRYTDKEGVEKTNLQGNAYGITLLGNSGGYTKKEDNSGDDFPFDN